MLPAVMLTTRSHDATTLCALALTMLATLSLAACTPDKAERAETAMREGQDVAKIKTLVKENAEAHVEAVTKVAAKVAPLFEGEEPPTEEKLRATLAGVVKPPEVIQTLVFSPVDLTVVVDTDGVILARDRDAEGGREFKGRNLFEESPELRAAFEKKKPTHVLGKLGRGENAVPYLYFIAPVERDGEAVAAAVVGYGLWKEGRRITLQMRRETEQGKERVLVIWAFAYLGDEFYKLPNSPLEVEQVVPDAATRRAELAKSPEGYITTARILQRELGVAVIPFPEIGEDFGIIYLR
jgi:hypothetical protein